MAKNIFTGKFRWTQVETHKDSKLMATVFWKINIGLEE